MPYSLNEKAVAEINSLVNKLCKSTSNKSELYQLAMLFSPKFRKELGNLLSRYMAISRKGFTKTVKVDIGWIDRFPKVKTSSIPNRVELGDAFIFYTQNYMHNRGKNTEYRAVIMQAKHFPVSSENFSFPPVPVLNNTSTKNELDFLSKWPQFDLFKATKDKTPLLTNVKITFSSKYPPYSLYCAAPQFKSANHENKGSNKNWKSWWMFARSSAGEQFNISYGDFLTNFMKNKNYGENFTWSGNFNLPPEGESWDRLCYEIIKHISSRNYHIMDKYRKIIGETIECKKVGFEIKYSFRSYLNWFIWKVCLCRKIHYKRKPVLLITLNTYEGL